MHLGHPPLDRQAPGEQLAAAPRSSFSYATLVSGKTDGQADFLPQPDSTVEQQAQRQSTRDPRRQQSRRPGCATRARQALDATVSLRADGAYGAGVLIGADGLVLTVEHVIRGAQHLRASLAGEAWQQATVLEQDRDTDLALLRLSQRPSPRHRPLALGSVLDAQAGDEIITVGSPHSMHFSVSRGIVSFVGRRFGDLRYLQTDLPAHPGSSGGPVLNEAGQLIGLMSFIDRRGERLAFAVPVDYALERFAQRLTGTRPRAAADFLRWSRQRKETPARHQADARSSL